MENLELKHLSPYLPYGLKVKYDRPNGLIENITSLYDIENDDDLKIKIGYSDAEHIWMFKPILRPLYDLSNVHLSWREKGLENIASNNDEYLISKNTKDTSGISRYFYEWLLENHFDVFGLIEKGLAIDINTLEL